MRLGNRVTILRNGATLADMLELITGAKETIDLSSYIFWPGDVADRYIDALGDRARAGVEVNMIVDGYGSAKLDKDHRDRLRRSGVNLSVFRPPRWHNVHKLNNRMHRRILVVDGRVGFAGGVGIADEWTGDAHDAQHWRETHLRIEGPAVRDLFGAFLENWSEATGELLTGRHFVDAAEGFDDGMAVQVMKSTPTGGYTAASMLFHAAIAGAQRRLWITTAYFAPDEAFEDALGDAARRGVDVRILVNGHEVDKEVARQAGHRSNEKLLEAGVRVFEYERTMMHAKVMLVDDQWANVGSSNFDSRSFTHDPELNVVLPNSPELVAELEGHFLDDFGGSREFELEAWRKRPVHNKVAEYVTDIAR
ncbi:MAG: phospholipase D-like domain-containing protein, partial [Actinomycetota bacterium]|nr:phospholipase D-like domain-containing protein [Actinomycetota bacterium]